MNWKDILKYKEPSYYKQKPWKGHAHAEKVKAKEREKLVALDEGEEMTEEFDFPERVRVDGRQWFLLTKLGYSGIYSINRVKRDEEGWQLNPAKEGDLDHTISLTYKEAQEAAI